VQATAKAAAADEKPLQIAEIFRAISDASFTDLPGSDGKAPAAKSSIVRRNLQREYVSRLAMLSLGKQSAVNFSTLFSRFGNGSKIPPDAKALARLHLKEIAKGVDAALKTETDDTAKAHYEDLKEQIAKVLVANVSSSGP